MSPRESLTLIATLSLQILGSNVFGQNEPADLVKLLDRFDRETQAIQLEADERISNTRRNLTNDLEALQDKFTKSAKLEEAIRVREWIRKINGFIELRVLQNPESKDFLLAASETTIADAEKRGYRLQGNPLGLILREQLPNTLPLITFFNPQKNDYLTVSTQEGISSGKPDYKLIAIEGYVYQKKYPSTVPVYLFWNGKDNATATEALRTELEKQVFKQVRIEGWILKIH